MSSLPLPNAPSYSCPALLILSSAAHFLHVTLLTPRRPAQRVQSFRNVRPHDWYTANKSSNCREEIPKQHQYAVQLNYEAEEGPAHQDQCNADAKC
jgi:hypothetical protein